MRGVFPPHDALFGRPTLRCLWVPEGVTHLELSGEMPLSSASVGHFSILRLTLRIVLSEVEWTISNFPSRVVGFSQSLSGKIECAGVAQK